MPVHPYEILTEHHLVLLPSVTAFEWDEWEAVMRAIFADKRYASGMNFLADRRNLRTPYPRPTIERIVQFFARHRDRMRGTCWATIAAGKDSIHDSLRLIAALTEPHGVRVMPFTGFDEAVEWVAPQTDAAERRNILRQLDPSPLPSPPPEFRGTARAF